MKNGKTILYRVYQGAMALALRVLPEKKQELVTGNGSFLKAAVILKQHGVHKVQIVTTAGIVRRGTLAPLLSELESKGIEAAVFDGVRPDPDLSCIECAAKSYRDEGCDAFLSVGGGSAIDCTKLAAARTVKPEQPVEKMKGTLKVRRKLPFTVAVPTTAGTGSEVTPFAVITDETTGVKYPLADYELLPKMSIVDADMMMNAPKGLTAASGIDAVTHALEAYASMMATDYTDGLALRSLKLIFDNLPSAYENGAKDPKARENMANAACMAGMAFANAFLGVCHSMAHKLGAFHHLPHGVANALMIDEVLRFNAAEVPAKMGTFSQYDHPHTLARYAEVADYLKLGGATDEEKLEKLIAAIDELKAKIGIRKTIRDYGIDETDFLTRLDSMVEQAFDDQCTGANPRYPLMSEIKQMYLNAYYGTDETK